MSTGDGVPAALAAFVRGNERRAWLFLWLQGGRVEVAGQALAAGIRAFHAQAGTLPMAQWPSRFWRTLAASPLAGEGGQWPASMEALAQMPAAPRRALLLRLAAGLDEVPAAEALGLELDAYRGLLGQACPRDAQGHVDAQAWHALAQAVQQEGRELAPRRLLWIADLREAALAGRGLAVRTATLAAATGDAATDPGTPRSFDPPARRRWIWPLLVVAACAAALAATLWMRPALPGVPAATTDEAPTDDLRVRDPGPILVEPLPDDALAPAVEATLPAAIDEPAVEPVVDRFDLLAWYAAGAPGSRVDREGGGATAPPMADQAATGTAVAGPGTAGGTGPVRVAAWLALPAAEQAQVRAADSAFSALPGQEQAALQARFASLDGMERHGWLLGPALGSDWPVLQPLLGYVGEEERQPLLHALRQLGPEARAQLGELGRRTPADGRLGLRREFLAVPGPGRAAWVARRSLQ